MQYHKGLNVKVFLYPRISWKNPRYYVFRSNSIAMRNKRTMKTIFNWVRWSNGSTFHCRLRGLWFESYTGLSLIFSGHKKLIFEAPLEQGVNWYPERACLCKFDIPGRCMLAAYKTVSEIVSPGRPECSFPNIAQ